MVTGFFMNLFLFALFSAAERKTGFEPATLSLGS